MRLEALETAPLPFHLQQLHYSQLHFPLPLWSWFLLKSPVRVSDSGPSLSLGEQASVCTTNLLHYAHTPSDASITALNGKQSSFFKKITFLTFEVSKALQRKALFWQYRAFWGRASVIYKGRERHKEKREGHEEVKAKKKNCLQPCQGTCMLEWERTTESPGTTEEPKGPVLLTVQEPVLPLVQVISMMGTKIKEKNPHRTLQNR